ncbi:MAG: LLM class flavin-dependent oxidoreductase [Chloroflexi bacterium]|nr:LLM class flavin-dependent oxidoreductase [Chloroflexota bacterium]
MNIGVGMDASLRLTPDQEAEVSRQAARMGYTSVWTTAGAGYDAFQLCLHRWNATRAVVPEGLGTGIAVYPVEVQTPLGFAVSAATASDLTNGHFILGVGSGEAYRDAYQGRFGRGVPLIALMRDYLTIIKALLRGETVDYEGKTASLHGVTLRPAGARPLPRTPVYLGALGPQMLRLGGELADGISLNWCTPEQIAWSRERVAEGAAKVGRDPSSVHIAEYIRICVDDDVQVARRAYIRTVMGYALRQWVPSERERGLAYRGHFERMGFTEALARLDDMRRRQATEEELIQAFPDDLAMKVGYFGAARGAAQAFRTLAQGLDTAIVRVVAARPTVDSALAVMEACRPVLTG